MLRLWLLLLAATPAVPQDDPVRVFAAASLTDALGAAIRDFESANPSIRVVPQFGGSSDLARQIIAGAPADLFFSADREQVDRVASAGLIHNGLRSDVLSNELVVVRHRDRPGVLEDVRDLGSLQRIAMADPYAVPAGVYARRYLETLDLWSELGAKVVPTLDVRGALAAVGSGNVDAGFVYRTDAGMDERVKVVHVVSRREGPSIVYTLGVVDTRPRAGVSELYDYLRSKDASDVFARFGFLTPDTP